MKISLDWLRQYLECSLNAEEISQQLTSIGLEVDGMEAYVSHPGGLEGLVVGQVLGAEPHPNADKLRLTQVNVGRGEPLSIVCGAPNVAAGQKVIVALIGTTLYPSSGEPFTIKKAKIRGESSEGMLCAEDEIGLGSSHDGILVLPPETAIGLPAATYFNVRRDTLLEIGLTPNRSDAFSHLGVARDLYAALRARGLQARLTLPEPAPLPPNAKSAQGNRQEGTLNGQAFAISLPRPEACLRYTGIALRDVNVGPSPEWLRQRLAAIGVRSINNVVDVTNFILHEYGQPLHAFDADAIRGGRIEVKTLPAGTPFVALDGNTRSLRDSDLMICDAEGPLAMAGIYGGLSSGVTGKTTRLFLESACFDPRWIRRSFTAHGLRTDAAVHFEKGTDPNMTAQALARAVEMLRSLSGAELASDLLDVYPAPAAPRLVPLRWDRLTRLIGAEIPQAEARNILKFLGMELRSEDAQGLLVAVPTDKTDVTREADLIEEVLRIYGMDRIALPGSLRSNIVAPQADANEQRRFQIANFLNGAGFSEIFSNPITRSRYLAGLPEIARNRAVVLANSLNAELDIMRPDLLFGGLEAAARNVNRRQENLRLFEFGRVFEQEDGQIREREQLGLWLCGNRHPESWRQPAAAQDYFDLKAAVELVLKRFNCPEQRSTSTENSLLEYGLDYWVGEQKTVSFGRVRSEVNALLDLRLPVYYAAMEWDVLSALGAARKPRYQPLSRFPAVRRDLALVLDRQTAFRDVEVLARKKGGNWLREVFLFDAYEGPNLGEGRKSYGIGLSFSNDEATLTDKQVDTVMQDLIRAYETELNATIRR